MKNHFLHNEFQVVKSSDVIKFENAFSNYIRFHIGWDKHTKSYAVIREYLTDCEAPYYFPDQNKTGFLLEDVLQLFESYLKDPTRHC